MINLNQSLVFFSWLTIQFQNSVTCRIHISICPKSVRFSGHEAGSVAHYCRIEYKTLILVQLNEVVVGLNGSEDGFSFI